MMKQILTAALLAALATGGAGADDLDWLEAYNVAWSTPSANSSESMPVGGHDMGLNVWVENGELLIYLARAGCYDENGALLKLGRVRVNLDPNPFAGDGYFRQELKLREGCVEIRAGRGEVPEATVRVWVEVHRPVAHVEIEADQELNATATYESWRYEPMELSNDRSKYGRRGMVMMDYDQYAGAVVVQPDVIEPREDGVVFSHRNRDQTVFDFQVRQQSLEAVRDQMHDRLARPTFWPEDIDWVPDHNWGGAGMVGLQEMLLQTHAPAPASLHGEGPGETLRLDPNGEKLRLLPAWPNDWDVDFRLHAPRQTIVEGRVRDGQLVSWTVSTRP